MTWSEPVKGTLGTSRRLRLSEVWVRVDPVRRRTSGKSDPEDVEARAAYIGWFGVFLPAATSGMYERPQPADGVTGSG